MYRRIIRFISLLTAFVGAAVVATPSQAVPAYARQTGKACNTCHFQHYPALNAYGREFKAGGYTDMGKQSLLKGSDLSLPSVLNASLFFKFRYQDTNGKDLEGDPSVASGEWQIPDEFALLFGGRVTENIGFMLEGQLADPDAPFLAGFKMPAMYKLGETDMKAGVVPYTTDALGASYGFELLNTGAVRNVRINEHRAETSAQQYIGTATAATGAAFVLWHPQFFANISRWTPNHAGDASGQKLSSTYVRAAYTPSVGDWDLGVGVQSWSGTAKDATGIGANETKAWAVDFQAQGIVANLPVGVYLTHAKAAATSAGSSTPNLYNANPNAKTATTILGEVGILPGKATLQLGYRRADTGSAAPNPEDNAWTVGATYQFAQNVQLQVQHSSRSKGGAADVGRYEGTDVPGSSLTTFMLSAGF
ncbi:MAG: hypothetical protein KJ634_03440 [Gammaproteobacteria bacterium]|nr:hypothetical protein [Gammaproteobacteria bacterium]MBU1414657.1 hypothetical protein [Gammaproteobacteria bacterium]